VLAQRARYDRRLTEPLTQLDFVVNDGSVLQRVLDLPLPEGYGFSTAQFVSVADLAWPEHAAACLRQLAGSSRRDPEWDALEPGRLPLYACPECADLCCGALTVAVRREVDGSLGRELVHWDQLRCEAARTPDEQLPNLSAVGSFAFDAAQHDAVLVEALERLDALALTEQHAQQALSRRRLRVRLRGLVSYARRARGA